MRELVSCTGFIRFVSLRFVRSFRPTRPIPTTNLKANQRFRFHIRQKDAVLGLFSLVVTQQLTGITVFLLPNKPKGGHLEDTHRTTLPIVGTLILHCAADCSDLFARSRPSYVLLFVSPFQFKYHIFVID